MNLKDGLYEQVINEIISNKINNLCDKKYIDKTKIDEAESSSVLAQYMCKVMQKSLNYVQENKGDDITKLKKQIDMIVSFIKWSGIRTIINVLKEFTEHKKLRHVKINRDNIDFIEEKMNLNFPCPLELHCRYSRDEILSAVGTMRKIESLLKERV